MRRRSDFISVCGARTRGADRRRPRRRCAGFSLVEVLLSLAISAMLLSAVMVSLDASFRAYRSTTESASRHTIARLTMHRMLSLIRTGSEFGPYPANVITDPIISSDYIEFITRSGELIRIEYDVDTETFYVIEDPGGTNTETVLITGVPPQYDDQDQRILPFTMHYGIGPTLYRATIDFEVAGDPNVEFSIEYEEGPPLRLVASTMPRNNL